MKLLEIHKANRTLKLPHCPEVNTATNQNGENLYLCYHSNRTLQRTSCSSEFNVDAMMWY